ncbi:transcriptional activator [Perilla frutescens var. hirtella]|uniref:RAB6-interacting golgin n=1 Tax=Perilla frutescens var. hirtella TaxID=608512 RepID=A0AAD4JG77_PERFH|nr:transcriptional activator [Perilla frutescens var. frutescens]KAH6833279.1 transcriptional activator [Perilla frutescens var. hirtella]
MTKSALAAFRAKEEEIQRRRSEIRERVQAQLGRVEAEAKRLLQIHGELESLTDPMRKEVAVICKRVELINRDAKLFGLNCQKKEKEYKEAIEAFNEKNREKGQLIAKLVELVTESEKVRSKKLEELCKNI